MHDEGVPGRDERAGERGDHDRVVDVGHDAETCAGGHDEHARLDRLTALDRHLQGLPARLQRRGQIGVDHATPIGDGDLSFGTTLSYRSKTYQFEIPNPYIDQKGYALWDASIVYTAPDDRWTLGLHGKNLMDKEYKTSGYTFVAANAVTGAIINNAAGFPTPTLGREGTLTAFYGNPRQVFLTGTVKF